MFTHIFNKAISDVIQEIVKKLFDADGTYVVKIENDANGFY